MSTEGIGERLSMSVKCCHDYLYWLMRVYIESGVDMTMKEDSERVIEVEDMSTECGE